MVRVMQHWQLTLIPACSRAAMERSCPSLFFCVQVPKEGAALRGVLCAPRDPAHQCIDVSCPQCVRLLDPVPEWPAHQLGRGMLAIRPCWR